MSRFYKFINEDGKSRVYSISKDDAKRLIRENCQKSSQGSPIYRGTWSISSDYGYGDSRTDIPRMSANTKNYYTIIIDNSGPGRKFPKRSQSFICSTEMKEPATYGDLYRVIPYDGTPIGVCPSIDMWLSFRDFEYVNIFTENIYKLAKEVEYDANKMQRDYFYLLKGLDEIGKYIRKNDVSDIIPAFKRDLIKFYNDFKKTDDKYLSDFIIEKLDPKRNGFKLKKTGSKLPPENEVWFSGEAVFISQNRMNHIEIKSDGLLNWSNEE